MFLLKRVKRICHARKHRIAHINLASVSALDDPVRVELHYVLPEGTLDLLGALQVLHPQARPTVICPQDVGQRAQKHPHVVFDRLAHPSRQPIVELHTRFVPPLHLLLFLLKEFFDLL